VLLFVGRFLDAKGGDTLIRALAMAPGQFCLALAGAGEREARWRGLAGDLGVGDRTYWLGYLNSEQLAAAYYSSDVFVLPSRSEPHGNVVNEAAAAGLPVVVSDGVGTDVVVEGLTGLRFHAEDSQELASALAALSDADRRREMGEAGAARVREYFSLECQVSAYRVAIDQVLRCRSRGETA
jgi:glycosyltransferase involved in cell wall biosynthesis